MKAAAFAFLLLSLFAHAEIQTKWEYVGRDRDVEVYKGEVKGTSVVAFRGVGEIDAPMTKVLSILYDTSRILEWMHELKVVKILERKNKFDKIEYNITRAPWPMMDRDFVYSVTVHTNDDRSVLINIENATHPKAPESKDLIRGKLYSSKYFLRPLENGKTYFELELLADPKGSIPKWLVNMTQKSWPTNTINGIRKIAAEPNYQVHPDITAAFGDK